MSELTRAHKSIQSANSHMFSLPAVNGFVRSIDLGGSAEKKKNGHVQQDILRLLTLWFKYGNRSDVAAAIEDGFNQLSIDTWLNVIPQVIDQNSCHERHVGVTCEIWDMPYVMCRYADVCGMGYGIWMGAISPLSTPASSTPASAAFPGAYAYRVSLIAHCISRIAYLISHISYLISHIYIAQQTHIADRITHLYRTRYVMSHLYRTTYV